MEYIYDITLSLVPAGDIPVVSVKQGDSSMRFIRARITTEDGPLHPGAEQTVLFREEKPDGTGVLLDNTYQDETLGRYLVAVNGDGTVTVELTDQATSCPGLCKCDICFVQSDRSISTAPFILDVDASPDVTHSVVSSDDFRTLINALENVDRTNVSSLNDMTDTMLNGVAGGQVLVFDATQMRWVNRPVAEFGYLTEQSARELIEEYQFQTAEQVNTLIRNYIASIDGNEIRY